MRIKGKFMSVGNVELEKRQAVLEMCHTMKSHFSARSMAFYLLRKKTALQEPQQVAEVLDILESSLQKELDLLQQIEQLESNFCSRKRRARICRSKKLKRIKQDAVHEIQN